MSAPLQLRCHIPIAAPARREPVDGTEPPLRPVVGFEPRWFHERCQVDFSERWHRDPDYRAATLARMLATLRRTFPQARQWDGPDERHIWTIGGCYGVGVIPRLFGLGQRFHPDRWPELVPAAPPLDDLDPERILAHPFAREVLEQVEAMAARGTPVAGDLNWQGVLNLAFHLRGQEIFIDIVERPAWATALFTTITEVLIGFARRVHALQRASGFPIDFMCVSNCTVNMISPRLYTAMLAPHDERIALAFARFGVHTCNWDATPYLEAFSRLPKVGYLDMGLQSNLRAARERFPHARRGVFYAPWKLKESTANQMRRDLARIARELAPCDVIAADIAWDTPDDCVRRFLDLCAGAASNLPS